MLATRAAGGEEGEGKQQNRSSSDINWSGATCMRHGSSDSSAKLVVGLATGHMLPVFRSESLSSSV